MSRSVSSRRFKSADSGTNISTLNRDCGEAKAISRPTAQSGSNNEKLRTQEAEDLGYKINYADTNIKLFATTEGDQIEFLTHQRNIYSIDSVSGIPNRSHEYHCMDTLSNTETLAIGSTMSDHKFQMENTDNLPNPSCNLTKISKTEQLDYTLTEKHVSPPSAFVDRVG